MASKNTERVQAVLNQKYFRETDALTVRRILLEESEGLSDSDPEHWNDRKLITEGLIALGEKLNHGWSPPTVPNEMTISANVVNMLAKLNKTIEMLSRMDISKLREIDGFDEDTFETMRSEGLKSGAARMFSDDTVFDDDKDW